MIGLLVKCIGPQDRDEVMAEEALMLNSSQLKILFYLQFWKKKKHELCDFGQQAHFTVTLPTRTITTTNQQVGFCRHLHTEMGKNKP